MIICFEGLHRLAAAYTNTASLEAGQVRPKHQGRYYPRQVMQRNACILLGSLTSRTSARSLTGRRMAGDCFRGWTTIVPSGRKANRRNVESTRCH